MNDKMISALDDCLAALAAGVTLEECLQRYPDLAHQLRPALEVLIRAQAHLESVEPAPGKQSASRGQFLAQARAVKSSLPKAVLPATPVLHKNGHNDAVPASLPQGRFSLSDFFLWLSRPLSNQTVRAFTFIIVVVMMGAGVVNASAQSLPGAPLYGLKRTLENTRLNLTPSGEDRAKLEDELIQQRRLEAIQIGEQGKQVALDFGGMLETMQDGRWSVSGIVVILRADVKITGNPQPGLYLHIVGTSNPDGSVYASEISVEGEIFQGNLDKVQGSVWMVSDRKVFVNTHTRIDQTPQIGAFIEVNAVRLSDGSFLAERIRLLSEKPSSEKSPESHSNSPEDQSPTQDSTKKPDDNRQDDRKSPTPQGDSHTPTNQGRSTTASVTPTKEDNSGKSTLAPTRTPEPTRTQSPTQTPNSGGKTATPVQPQPDKEVRFQGTLESISSDTWVVAGQTLRLSSATQFDNNLKIGDLVEVQAQRSANGSLQALRIRKRN